MKILRISSSIKGDASESDKLAKTIVTKLIKAYPESSETVLELSKTHFSHLDPEMLGAFYTPQEQRSEAQHQAVKPSEKAIQQIFDADIIVIGIGFYNFGIPDKLKTWIDHIVRSGQTFKVEDGKAIGLLTGKKVYLAIASGWAYAEGPMKAMDFTEPYLRAVLNFIGLNDITTFRAENIGLPDLKESSEKQLVQQLAAHDF